MEIKARFAVCAFILVSAAAQDPLPKATSAKPAAAKLAARGSAYVQGHLGASAVQQGHRSKRNRLCRAGDLLGGWE